MVRAPSLRDAQPAPRAQSPDLEKRSSEPEQPRRLCRSRCRPRPSCRVCNPHEDPGSYVTATRYLTFFPFPPVLQRRQRLSASRCLTRPTKTTWLRASLPTASQIWPWLYVVNLPNPPVVGIADPPYQSEDDFPYEQDLQRNPGSTKPWLAYVEYKLQHGTLREQAFVMERACVQLPRSYKLWKMVRLHFPVSLGGRVLAWPLTRSSISGSG